jgi:hypothetical protein
MAKKKYRFSIFNDTTHEEIFSVRAYGVLSIITLAVAVVLLIASVTVLISFTSLREFIPGYPSAQSRHELVENAIKIDSLQNEVNHCQHQGAKAAGEESPLHKIFHIFFHFPSSLLLISAKQRLETYSR